MKKLFLQVSLLGLFLTQTSVKCQQIDTTINLNQIEVKANRLYTFSVGEKIDKIGAKDLQKFWSQQLSDVLSESSLVNMKSYGTSGLTTFRMRGGTADHTAILWNGFNLQSPMSGEMNLFLIPAIMIDEVQVHYGGEGAVSGSGAVGGVVELNNTFTQKQGVSGNANIGIGSFGKYRESAKVNLGFKKVKSTFAINHQQAENDFVYYNEQRIPASYEKMKNSAYKQFGMSQNNAVDLSNRSKLQTFFWYQFTDRQVAPQKSRMFTDDQQEYTVDNDLRFAVKYLHSREKWIINSGAALLRNSMHYVKSSIKTDVTHVATGINLNADAQRVFNQNNLINIAYSGVVETVNSPNYTDTPVRLQNYLLASYKYSSTDKRLNGVLSLREGVIENDLSPLLASVQLRYSLFDEITIKAKIARNYKVADFNDIYWVGTGAVGNSNLKPENGWSGDFGLSWTKDFNNFNVSADATGFYSAINDMIIWQNMGAFWIPENQDKVKTYGLESKLAFGYTIGDLNIKLQGQYSYTLPKADGEKYNGNILPYSPKHTGNALLFIGIKDFYLQYGMNYVGETFTKLDNVTALKNYTLSNIKIGTQSNLLSKKLNVAFGIDNLWDVDYQAIQGYVMMPINYNLSVGLSF